MENTKSTYLDCVLEILRVGLITPGEASILYAASRIQERLLLNLEPGSPEIKAEDIQGAISEETKIMFLDPKMTN